MLTLLALRPGVRILFMSGHSSDETVRQGHIARDQAFLARLFTLDELASQVRDVLATLDCQVIQGYYIRPSGE